MLFKCSRMKSNWLSMFILSLCLFYQPVLADNTSSIAVALDEETCGSGSFIPLNKSAEILGYDLHLNRLKKDYGSNCKINGIGILGPIQYGDAKLFSFALNLYVKAGENHEKKYLPSQVWLDSSGGLISEALKIGYLIAENNLKTIVPFKGKCLSSCVLVYAAGSHRLPIGDIGVHRPFSYEISVKDISYTEYLNKYDKVTVAVKEYFLRFGVSATLVDLMNATPSDSIRMLSLEELKDFGLYQNVAYIEYQKSKEVENCGTKFVDLKARFFSAVNRCKLDKGIKYSWEDGSEQCFDYAHYLYPDYATQLKTCTNKK